MKLVFEREDIKRSSSLIFEALVVAKNVLLKMIMLLFHLLMFSQNSEVILNYSFDLSLSIANIVAINLSCKNHITGLLLVICQPAIGKCK